MMHETINIKKYVTYNVKQKCTKHTTIYKMIKKRTKKNMKEYDDSPIGSKHVTLLFKECVLFFLYSSCVRLYSLSHRSDKEMLDNHSYGFSQYELVPPLQTLKQLVQLQFVAL